MDLCIQTSDKTLRVAQIDTGVPGAITLPALEEFLHIIDNEPTTFLDSGIKKMISNISKDPSLWALMITQSKRDEIISTAVRSIKGVMIDADNQNYLASWMKIREFLDSLGRISVVPKAWSQLREKFPAMQGPSFSASVMTGRLPWTIYSTAGSSTGRLTVSSGPNFLIAPAEARTALRPSFPDSDIVIIDFSSMEPRVALMATGGDAGKGDVYRHLMKVCGIEDRAAAKLATISALYGASESRLIETTGSRARAKSIIESVRNFFNVTVLEDRLEQQAQTGMIRNFFGRPLHKVVKTPRLRVNHFSQSTAAELAVLLFIDLCSKVRTLRPLLVIHDALIAEIPRSDFRDLEVACQKLEFKGATFPTKMEVI